MIRPGTVLWFARHELRLASRDFTTMLRGGRRWNGGWAALAVVIFVLGFHAIAYGVLDPLIPALLHPDKAILLAVTGSVFLAWTLSLSQAMETATRGFYARMDLDLILSSPASARRLFVVRIVAIAVSATAMSALIAGPFINVMAILGGPRFLLGYIVLMALGSTSAAVATSITVLLFRLFGPKRTRLLAQILAAVVGAGFIIGVQVAAIMSSGSISRMAILQSPALIAATPALDSPVWWVARAGLGDARVVLPVLGIAFGVLAVTAAWAAGTFAQNVVAVAGLSRGRTTTGKPSARFKTRSQAQVLRRKEWMLLQRDPWLVSQSLMQVLYLAPPALMLWHDFGSSLDILVILVPILVMAAGQLGGGLAWLALSGEDAPDLVASAPISPVALLRAKIEAVLIAVTIPIIPFFIAMALISPFIAGIMGLGAAAASAGACAIQLFFKSQAKRSNFRRRQTSSRLATFSEAFLSISLAGASGLAAAGLWLAVVPLGIAMAVLCASRAFTNAVAM